MALLTILAALHSLRQDHAPSLQDVLSKISERAANAPARATIEPEIDALARSPDHDWWEFHTLDDGACFIVHERISARERPVAGAGWTLIRPSEARALVRREGTWASYAFTPRGELPDALTSEARLVLYNIRPDLLPVLEPELRLGAVTADRVELVTDARTFIVERKDWTLVEARERPLSDILWFVGFLEPITIKLPSRARYASAKGDARKVERLLDKNMAALDWPLLSPGEYRDRLSRNPADAAAAYGLYVAGEREHRRRIVDAALDNNAAEITRLQNERKQAFAALAEGNREIVGASLAAPADPERIRKGSLALRAAHAWMSPSQATVTASDLPDALSALWPPAAAPPPASARDAHVRSLRLLSRGAPKPGPEDQIRASGRLSSLEDEPFAVADVWRALGEIKTPDQLGDETRAAFETWCTRLPAVVSSALRWRVAVIDGRDPARAARQFMESLSGRGGWPAYARRFALQAADRIFIDASGIDTAPLCDLVLEGPGDEDDDLRKNIASRLSRSMLANPNDRLFRLITRFHLRDLGSSDEKFQTWSLERLREAGTRDELVAFARWLAAEPQATNLAQVLDIMFSRFPDDEEVVEAGAVRRISSAPTSAFATFERLLQSASPARRATAMIGMAECVSKDSSLAKKAVEAMRPHENRANGLGACGWLRIGMMLGQAGEHEFALAWARRGLDIFLRLPPAEGRTGERKSTFRVMLGGFLDRAGRLEEAMREYKSAVRLRASERGDDAGAYAGHLSWLVDFKMMVIFDDREPAHLPERFYKTHGDDVFIKRRLAGALPRLEDEKAARDAFGKLSSDDPAEREQATVSLRKMGAGALSVLKDGLDSPDAELRARVVSLGKELAEPE